MNEVESTKLQLLKDIMALRQQLAQLTADVTAEQREGLAWVAQREAYGILERRLQQQTAELALANEAHQAAQRQHRQLQEDLHGTSEELASAYVELRVAGTELSTTRWEYQMTSREYQRIIQQHQIAIIALCCRVDELTRQNERLTQIISRLHLGVVILDHTLTILAWNRGAERLWGTWAEEVEGIPFMDLAVGFSAELLRAPIHACLVEGATQQAVVLDVTTRRGHAIKCRFSCTLLVGAAQKLPHVMVVMEPLEPDTP
jgi:two-component system CheB/CheR fusion protein